MLTNPPEHLRAGRASGWAAAIFNVGELMGEAEAAIRASVEAPIRLFGSGGKGP